MSEGRAESVLNFQARELRLEQVATERSGSLRINAEVRSTSGVSEKRRSLSPKKEAARLITILEKTLNQEVSHAGRLVLRHGNIPTGRDSSFGFRDFFTVALWTADFLRVAIVTFLAS